MLLPSNMLRLTLTGLTVSTGTQNAKLHSVIRRRCAVLVYQGLKPRLPAQRFDVGEILGPRAGLLVPNQRRDFRRRHGAISFLRYARASRRKSRRDLLPRS